MRKYQKSKQTTTNIGYDMEIKNTKLKELHFLDITLDLKIGRY